MQWMHAKKTQSHAFGLRLQDVSFDNLISYGYWLIILLQTRMWIISGYLCVSACYFISWLVALLVPDQIAICRRWHFSSLSHTPTIHFSHLKWPLGFFFSRSIKWLWFFHVQHRSIAIVKDQLVDSKAAACLMRWFMWLIFNKMWCKAFDEFDSIFNASRFSWEIN